MRDVIIIFKAETEIIKPVKIKYYAESQEFKARKAYFIRANDKNKIICN